MLFGSSSRDKGKSAARSGTGGREDISGERSPLLGQSSTTSPAAATGVRHGRGLLSDDDDEDDDSDNDRDGSARRIRRRSNDSASSDDLLASSGRRRSRHIHRRRYIWRSILLYVFLALLGLAFVAFAIIHIWLGRFVSEQFKNDAQAIRDRAPDALVYRGPDKVRILEMSKDKSTVQIEMRMGIDPRIVFGWNDTFSTHEGLTSSRKWERRLVGWAVRRIGQASMDLPEPVLVSSKNQTTQPFMQFTLSSPIALPLYFPKSGIYDPNDISWLRNITITVPAQVLEPGLMATFINQTMDTKEGEAHIAVRKAHVALGKEEDRTWLSKTVKKYGGQTVENVQTDVRFAGRSNAAWQVYLVGLTIWP